MPRFTTATGSSSSTQTSAMSAEAAEMVPIMRRYVPLAITLKAVVGRDGSSEMRHATILFIGLTGLDLDATRPDLVASAQERGEAALQRVHTEVHRREGQVNKMLVDDKGVVLLCAFGLPPRPHADDALRSVQSAMAIASALDGSKGRGAISVDPDENHGLGGIVASPTAFIGVATGRVFCGVVGSRERREFTTMGDSVNIAARV